MPEILEQDLVSYDPLSDVTRKERTALLGFSMLGLALVAVPLVPEKFGVFGIEFSKLNQTNFLSLYALLLVYYLLAFLIYAFTDYVAWLRIERIRYSAYLRAGDQTTPNAHLEKPQPAKFWLDKSLNPVYYGFASFAAARVASRTRAAFEFVLPVAFSVYVVCRLLTA